MGFITTGAQEAATLPTPGNLPANIINKYLDATGKKLEKLTRRVQKQNQKQLKKILKSNKKLLKLTAAADSAGQTYLPAIKKLNELLLACGDSSNTTALPYIPGLDTLIGSLTFIQQGKAVTGKLTGVMNKVPGLETELKKTAAVQKLLQQRQQLLGSLSKKIKLPAGWNRQLQLAGKQAYYWQAQLNEYKAALKDYKKAEQKLMQLLTSSKKFKEFMSRNSRLAGLLRLPASTADPAALQASLAGLQTRAQVTALLQQQAGSPAALGQLQQNLQGAQQQLSSIQNQALQYLPFTATNNSDDIMPRGFIPNTQKTKTFLQRIELGSNLQSQKGNSLLPVTTDVGISAGYKLNDKSIIGLGASYKLGWGPNIRNIQLSHEGLGLRSFIDWKLKGSFWLSGGYEGNYLHSFNSIAQLRQYSSWQQSGLLGVSKQLSLKTKFFKQTRLQLLWDFLSYQQVPRAQPLLFRVGYVF